MSYRLKDTTIENGFVRNPDRVYYEDFFNEIPLSSGRFVLPSSEGNTDFTIIQPANTFIKDISVIVKTAPVITTSGNCGISISHTDYQDVSSGSVVAGSAANIFSNTTTIAVNTYISLSLVSATIRFTPTARLLYVRITTSKDASTVGLFHLVPTFANLNSSIYIGSSFLHFDSSSADSTHQNNAIIDYNSNSVYAGITLNTHNISDNTVTANNISSLSSINKYNSNLSNGILKTDGTLEFETSIIIPTITTMSFYAGLKLTNTPLITTDADQALFIYGNQTPLGTTGSTSTSNLLFVYSIGGTDYVTDLGLELKADTLYNLRIHINKHRYIYIYVNGIQYGLASTSGTVASSATNSYDTNSSQLTDNISLYPVIGIQNTSAGSDNERTCIVNYVKCSRNLEKI